MRNNFETTNKQKLFLFPFQGAKIIINSLVRSFENFNQKLSIMADESEIKKKEESTLFFDNSIKVTISYFRFACHYTKKINKNQFKFTLSPL